MFKLHKSYKKMSKKELLEHLAFQKEQNCSIVWENYVLNKENTNLEKQIRSAESALAYKDRVIEKYQRLLSFSVEDV